MLPLGLLFTGAVVPALAFAFPVHSSARTVLATGIVWWALPFWGAAWLAWVDYSFYSRVDGEQLRVFTVRGRRMLELSRLDRIRSFSLWGQFGGAHALRLHTSDGQHAMVVASMALAGLNRRNLSREQKLRQALAAHAELADARARWWLGAGPRRPRLATARHFLAMLALYVLTVIAVLVALVAYFAVALH